MDTQPTYINRRNAALFVREELGLSCSPTTLDKLASTGGGPTFYKFGGRAFYVKADLIAWVESKLTKREQVAA